MPTLLELQRAFGAYVLADEGSVTEQLARWCGGVPQGASQRLAIYRNTATSTLGNALALAFPAVRRLVGAEFFAAAAQQFLRIHPPASAYLNGYGDEFAQFLRSYAPAAGLPYLPDVAQLEWAVNRALHAPDQRRLHAASLAQLDALALARVALVTHASVTALTVRHPADLIWRAVLEQDEAAMTGIDLTAGPVWLLVERDLDELVQVHRLSSDAWRLTACVCEGQPLYRALALESGLSARDQQRVLAEHLAARRFVDFRLAADNTREQLQRSS